jgi:hypothetical protein
MDTSYYLYLKSNDSKNVPQNTPGDFTIELPRTLHLSSEWECSLKEVISSSRTNTVYVCSDLCVESFACGTAYPILRVIHNKSKQTSTTLTFIDPYYVTVNKPRLDRLRIFIRGSELTPTTTKSDIVLLYASSKKSIAMTYYYNGKPFVPDLDM